MLIDGNGSLYGPCIEQETQAERTWQYSFSTVMAITTLTVSHAAGGSIMGWTPCQSTSRSCNNDEAQQALADVDSLTLVTRCLLIGRPSGDVSLTPHLVT